MRPRSLVRIALWTVLAANVALVAWWLLRPDATDAGTPGSRSWLPAEFDRGTMPVLPPRHAPVREEKSDEAPRAKQRDAGSAERAPSGPSHVVLQVSDASKAPLSGVTVVATESNGAVRSTATAADGTARFENVTPDAVEFVLSRGDLASQRIRPVALAPGVRTIKIEMWSGRAIDGVVLEQDGTPIAGAVVSSGDTTAWPATATSGYDGRFRIVGVPKSAQTLDVSAPLHTSAKAAVAGDVASVEVRLAPACRLYGLVSDASGAPVADALVTAVPEGDTGRHRAERGWTGADGRYAIDGMPLGSKWNVEATRPGFAPANSSAPVQLDAEHRSSWCNLALRPSARVTVRVVGDDGAPLSDVVVEVRLGKNGWLTRRSTDADGVVAFDVPGSGRCCLTTTTAQLQSWSTDFDLAEGDVRSLEMRRPPPGPVAGIVVDDRGDAVAGAKVQLAEATAVTDAEGKFRFDDVESGAHRVTTCAEAHTSVMSDVFDAPSESVRIVLPRHGSISFRLRADGRTIGRFWSGIVPAASTRTLRDALFPNPPSYLGEWDGRAVRLTADAGDARLVVQADGFVNVSRPVAFRPGEDTDLGEIALRAAVTLEVRVTDLADKPVEDASVSVGGQVLFEAVQTDTSGVARVEHVDPEATDSTVTVLATGFEVVSALPVGLAAPVVVKLRRLGSIAITVRDAGGGIVRNVSLDFASVAHDALPADRRGRISYSTDTTDGRWRASLGEGRWHVTVTRLGKTVAERDVDVTPGENPAVEITLEK